jgi:hypothetical protein
MFLQVAEASSVASKLATGAAVDGVQLAYEGVLANTDPLFYGEFVILVLIFFKA